VHRRNLVSLPIASDVRPNIALVADNNAYFGVTMYNYRTTAESVGIKRHYNYRIQTGMHNRPTDAESISSGARGGGDNQTVRALTVNKFFIYVEFKLDHA